MKLTERQTDVLHMLSIGFTRREVAKMLDLSESAVKHHLDAARDKLKAVNTVHTIALAVRHELI